MAERQLIVAVEGTAALGPFWPTILSDLLDKIIRSFCANELTGQKLSGANPELALVVFNTHGPYSAFVVQRSGWTKDMDVFFQWLSGMSFTGGGFSEAAIAEGLAEALMMFPATTNMPQSHQNLDAQKHCILVAASNPHPVPTPVYRPVIPSLEHTENAETQPETCLVDAEIVARSFGHCSISLSVISPKQLPTLRAIYSAGKRSPRAVDPVLDNIKSPQFLVLLSENFVEARTAFSGPLIGNVVSNQINAKLEVPAAAPISGPPPTSISSVNGSMMNRQPVPVGNMPTATVKVEPTTMSSMASGPAFSNVTSVPNITSQGVSSLQTSSPSPTSQEMNGNNESVQEFKPMVAHTLRPVGPAPANVSILNTLSRRQIMKDASIAGGSSIGLQTMGGTPMTIHMSNMISSGMASSAMSGIASLAGSGTLMGSAQVTQTQSTGLGSFGSTTSSMSGTSSIGISQPLANLQGNIGITQSVPGMGPGQGGMPSGGQIGQGGISMTQNIMNGLGPSGMSPVPGTMIPTPGMAQQSGVHSLGVTNNSSVNMALTQHASGVPQSQSKYVKIWEGALSGQRQGQPVFICKLEGYRSQTASETLAADWPATMQIVRLISQDHMNNKQYVGKADFLVFRTLNQHGFLAQLQEKKLCAVIQLPSQTLLLSVSDKASRLIGMLFPGDMVVFKPQMSSQQQQLQQQQQQQQQTHQQLQQQQQLQQLQQAQQHQQMIGSGMNQTFVQGTARSQIMPQGKMPQGHGSLSGGGFLP